MTKHNPPFFSLLLLFTLARASNPSPCPRIISSVGEATISAVPDIAAVSTAVVTFAETAEAALNQNNRQSQMILDTLSDFGVAARDIQTSSFNVNPRSQDQDGPFNPDQTEIIIGYRVSNRFSVTVRNLTNLGSILDGLVRAGSNSVSGVRFGIEDDQELRNQAKAMAVADAMREARVVAEAAGLRLGRLLTIRQGGRINGGIQFLSSAPPSDVPTSPGELEVQANLTVEFELLGTMG